DVKIDDGELVELLREIREGLNRIGVRHRVKDAVRGSAIPHAIGAPDIDDGFGDFERQPRAVFDRAAKGVDALVAAVAEELIEQIAIRAMQFDAVEAGRLAILGTPAELLDNARKLVERQRPRRDHLLRALGREHLALRGYCRGRDRKLAAVEIRMRDASDMPKLEEDFAAGAVQYRTCFLWVKDKIGMGYHARNQHELLFVCRRGNIPHPAPGDRVSSVIEAPRGRHSEKPVKVYELIEGFYPSLPKIELFARGQRPGWAAWGNEAGGAAS